LQWNTAQRAVSAGWRADPADRAIHSHGRAGLNPQVCIAYAIGHMIRQLSVALQTHRLLIGIAIEKPLAIGRQLQTHT
jgi:hypothetical protein